jgi:EAL domain-containing protein (putative c-di-GMP-specific phosphodiesterase class I)
VEALMRWNHPERGNIPPGIFIPRAEQSTLINLITEFALEQAMKQIVKWRQHDIHLPIAVNISPRNLLQPGFSDLILQLLQRYDVSGHMLELEVTEGALMTDIARTISELSRLANAKITISIDDFGTGYSSLQYLHQLPISLIKIDQSFVRRLPDDKGAVHIVEAAVTLAHKMGMKTIAEGVEEQSAYKLLADLGCDIAQGFMISRPLPAAEFEKWLAQYKGNVLYAQA